MTDAAYEVQEWLNRGYDLSLKIEAKKNHLLRKDAGGSGKPHEIQRSNDANLSEIREVEKSYIREEIENLEKQLHKIDTDTDKVLKNLEDGLQYTILYDRFVRRESWDRICDETEKSKPYVYEIKRKALETLAKNWKGHSK